MDEPVVLQGVDVGRIAHVVSNRAEMAEERRQRREHMRQRLNQSNAEDLLELLLRIYQRHPSHVLYVLNLPSANQDAGQPTSDPDRTNFDISHPKLSNTNFRQ